MRVRGYEGYEGMKVSHHHTPIASTPAHQSPNQHRHVPAAHPPIPTPAIATTRATNFVVDIEVGLGCNQHFDAFGVIHICRDVHWSLAFLWPHNTTHGRESVHHGMAPKGTRHKCTNKGQCGYGWTLHVGMHCALCIVWGYEGMRV